MRLITSYVGMSRSDLHEIAQGEVTVNHGRCKNSRLRKMLLYGPSTCTYSKHPCIRTYLRLLILPTIIITRINVKQIKVMNSLIDYLYTNLWNRTIMKVQNPSTEREN